MKRSPLFPLVILTTVLVLCPFEDLVGRERAVKPPGEETYETGEEWFWKGLFLMELGRQHWNEGIALLEKSSIAGWGPAMNMLGFYYLNGQFGVGQDPYKAREYFEAGVEAEDNFAKVSLAEALVNGWGGNRDLPKARFLAEAALDETAEYYTASPPDIFFEQLTVEERLQMDAVSTSVTSRLTNPVEKVKNAARLILGMIAKEVGDEAEAAAYFMEASNLENGGTNGISAATREAANCFALGRGVERDFDLAVRYLDLHEKLEYAASSEHAAFLYQNRLLGQMGMADLLEEAERNIHRQLLKAVRGYGNAHGNPLISRFDPLEATRWYALAAEKRDETALHILAAMYLEKDYASYDPAKARECFRRDWQNRRNALSGLNYAICLREGIGGAVDAAAAESILVSLSKTNFAAHLWLEGEGTGPPSSSQGSLKDLLEWVDQEDPHAQFCYGYRLENGIGVGISADRAEIWYAKAAEQGHASAMVSLSRLLINQKDLFSPEEAERIRGLLSEASKLGHIEADLQLANFKFRTELSEELLNIIALYEGYIEQVPDNTDALNQYARALGYLGSTRYFQNDTENKSAASSRIVSSLEKSAALGSIEAQYHLGQIYFHGYNIIPVDYSKALLHFQKATEWDPGVLFVLAEMYSRGEGTAADPDMAVYYFRKYLEKIKDDLSDPHAEEALDFLIESYMNGISHVRNPDMFLNWISLKSLKQPSLFYLPLGQFYLLEKRYDDALKLFKGLRTIEIKQSETITVGNSTFELTFAKPEEGILRGFALAGLGECYAEGLGVDKDLERAGEFYRKSILYRNADGFLWAAGKKLDTEDHLEGMRLLELAADRNSAAARFELGQRLLADDPEAGNAKLGLSQLLKAAEMGHAGACILLARATLNGQEGAPSAEEAIAFTLQAETLGAADTREILSELRKIREAEESRGRGSSWEQRLG